LQSISPQIYPHIFPNNISEQYIPTTPQIHPNPSTSPGWQGTGRVSESGWPVGPREAERRGREPPISPPDDRYPRYVNEQFANWNMRWFTVGLWNMGWLWMIYSWYSCFNMVIFQFANC
jgi:hypothetical protein